MVGTLSRDIDEPGTDPHGSRARYGRTVAERRGARVTLAPRPQATGPIDRDELSVPGMAEHLHPQAFRQVLDPPGLCVALARLRRARRCVAGPHDEPPVTAIGLAGDVPLEQVDEPLPHSRGPERVEDLLALVSRGRRDRPHRGGVLRPQAAILAHGNDARAVARRAGVDESLADPADRMGDEAGPGQRVTLPFALHASRLLPRPQRATALDGHHAIRAGEHRGDLAPQRSFPDAGHVGMVQAAAGGCGRCRGRSNQQEPRERAAQAGTEARLGDPSGHEWHQGRARNVQAAPRDGQ